MKFLVMIVLFAGCGDYLDPNLFATCDDNDHCRWFPASEISASMKSHLLSYPDLDLMCVPDRDVALKGYWAVQCTSFNGLEGRCLGTCIPEVKKYKELLPVDTCWAGEVCVPCWNPFANAWTSACSIDGDHPRE